MWKIKQKQKDKPENVYIIFKVKQTLGEVKKQYILSFVVDGLLLFPKGMVYFWRSCFYNWYLLCCKNIDYALPEYFELEEFKKC